MMVSFLAGAEPGGRLHMFVPAGSLQRLSGVCGGRFGARACVRLWRCARAPVALAQRSVCAASWVAGWRLGPALFMPQIPCSVLFRGWLVERSSRERAEESDRTAAQHARAVCMSQHTRTPCPAPFLCSNGRTARVPPVCVCVCVCVHVHVWVFCVRARYYLPPSHLKAPPHTQPAACSLSVRCTRALGWGHGARVGRGWVRGPPTLAPHEIAQLGCAVSPDPTSERSGPCCQAHTKGFDSFSRCVGKRCCGSWLVAVAGFVALPGMQLIRIRNPVLQRRASRHRQGSLTIRMRARTDRTLSHPTCFKHRPSPSCLFDPARCRALSL